MSHTAHEIQSWRNEVFRLTFSTQYPYIDRYFFSILYIEPKESLVATTATRADLERTVRQIRSILGQSGSVAVPQRFRDLFVCPGPGTLPDDWDLLAIRHSPLEKSQTERYAIIADSVLRLADAAVLIHRLRTGKSAIDSHPLLFEDPSTYVAKLLGVSPKQAAALHWLTDADAARAYGEHMAARLQGIGSKDSARSLAVAYRGATAELEANAAQNDDDWLWLTETFSKHHFRRGMVAALRSDLEEAGEGIALAADDLALRDQAISEYFTDYLNAAVARSNMLLQRRVLWLTIIAVLLAVLSLLQSWPVA
jgi:hypothetical protein